MKPILAFILATIVTAAPAGAAPRWLTAVPRAVGRTGANMVTFRKPALALEQWAIIGAMVFDQKTSLDAFHRCAGCMEGDPLSFFYRQRYGGGIAALDIALEGTFAVTAQQRAYELLKDDPNKVRRNLWPLVGVVPIALHADTGISNMRIPADKPGLK